MHYLMHYVMRNGVSRTGRSASGGCGRSHTSSRREWTTCVYVCPVRGTWYVRYVRYVWYVWYVWYVHVHVYVHPKSAKPCTL